MKSKRIGGACAALITGLMSVSASGHNYLAETEAPAGYVRDIAMRVPHGCLDSPVKQVRIKIPEDVYRVTVQHRDDWDVALKMREVDPPVVGDGGREITETVDEIIWSNPDNVLPADRVGEFKFRAKLPDEVGRILFFRTLNACVEGDDNYVDLPEMDLNLQDPDFHKKFWEFMTATATPSPYLILVKPERPQYPWEWEAVADRQHALPEGPRAAAAD